MGSIVYRDLPVSEAKLLGMIDRAECIDGIYRATNGVLELTTMRHEIASWSAIEIAAFVAHLQGLIDSGGRVFAAWDERRVVGVGALAVAGVGGNCAVMQLDMLYVSAGYRGRGIGRRLTEMAANLARSLGATALYISATPTRATVDAYLRMGANVLCTPDAELLAREPDDVHLVLPLA